MANKGIIFFLWPDYPTRGLGTYSQFNIYHMLRRWYTWYMTIQPWLALGFGTSAGHMRGCLDYLITLEVKGSILEKI